jgi:hemerythrin-like metal-binding protein
VQHRELLAVVAELEWAETGAHDSREAMLRVLDRVMSFATTHFVMEEALMAQVGYPSPAREEMVEQHRVFTEYVRQRVLEFHNGELKTVLPLRAFLAERLTAHEFGRDKLLADFIRDKGRGPQ